MGVASKWPSWSQSGARRAAPEVNSRRKWAPLQSEVALNIVIIIIIVSILDPIVAVAVVVVVVVVVELLVGGHRRTYLGRSSGWRNYHNDLLGAAPVRVH